MHRSFSWFLLFSAMTRVTRLTARLPAGFLPAVRNLFVIGRHGRFTLLNRYAHPQDDKVIELSSEMEKILTKM